MRKQLIEWMCANAKNRRTLWFKIPGIFGWDYKVYTIETVFRMEGFVRYSALKKLKLIPDQAIIRLQ